MEPLCALAALKFHWGRKWRGQYLRGGIGTVSVRVLDPEMSRMALGCAGVGWEGRSEDSAVSPPTV